MGTTAYQRLLKLLFTMKPERIHGLVSDCLGVLQFLGPVNRIVGKFCPVQDDVLAQEVMGIEFPRPLGLAAGFDKFANSPDLWAPVGFGYAEVGTVTASPQPGNPQPRLFRLPRDKAIINRMGFNNPGAAQVATNLYRRRYDDIIGVNIGKTKVVPPEEAVADYRRSAKLVEHLADYLTVNVSSPNTPGLRDLQTVDSLRPILEAVQSVTDIPVLVKISPDLADEDIDAIADLAVSIGLDGIVAVNTTTTRDGLVTPAGEVEKIGAGGLSGPVLADRALEVLKRLYARVGNHLVLVSVGGITTAEQAWERIAAGASLLQGYTGLIYGGPGWIRDIHRGIAAQIRAHGLKNISEAVGSGLGWRPVSS